MSQLNLGLVLMTYDLFTSLKKKKKKKDHFETKNKEAAICESNYRSKRAEEMTVGHWVCWS